MKAALALILAAAPALWAQSAQELRERMAREGDAYKVEYEFVSVGRDAGTKWRLGLSVKELRAMGYALDVTDAGEHRLTKDGRELIGRDAILPVIQQEHTHRYVAVLRRKLDSDPEFAAHHEVITHYFPKWPSTDGAIKISATVAEFRRAGYSVDYDDRGAPVFTAKDGRRVADGPEWGRVISGVWLAREERAKNKSAETSKNLERMASALKNSSNAGFTGPGGAGESGGSGAGRIDPRAVSGEPASAATTNPRATLSPAAAGGGAASGGGAGSPAVELSEGQIGTSLTPSRELSVRPGTLVDSKTGLPPGEAAVEGLNTAAAGAGAPVPGASPAAPGEVPPNAAAAQTTDSGGAGGGAGASGAAAIFRYAWVLALGLLALIGALFAVRAATEK